MSQGANVRSVDAIRDFKIALINFSEDARSALGGTEMEIRQVRNWLQRDQLTYWQSQVKRWQERISMARTELHRRQLMRTNSDSISDTEQKEAVREAQTKLRDAEEKVLTIKKWIPILEHALSEYNSQSQPLGDRLTGSFVATLNVLDRMTAALDSYLAMAPPVSHVPSAPRAEVSESMSETTSTVPSATLTATATATVGTEPAPPGESSASTDRDHAGAAGNGSDLSG